MSYVRTLTICLLLVYFVSAAGCHCFDSFTLLFQNLTQFAVETMSDSLRQKALMVLSTVSRSLNKTSLFSDKGNALFISTTGYILYAP